MFLLKVVVHIPEHLLHPIPRQALPAGRATLLYPYHYLVELKPMRKAFVVEFVVAVGEFGWLVQFHLAQADGALDLAELAVVLGEVGGFG